MTDELTQVTIPNRLCGSCNACCTHLGIDELKKRTGEKCKHLDTSKFGNKHCCRIYTSRPKPCQTFFCGWQSGLGPDNSRPDHSGLLISMYNDLTDPKEIAFTINIIDSSKSGDFTDETSVLNKIVRQILENGHRNIRLINLKNNKIIYFDRGTIYFGRVFPQEAYEDLTFQIEEKPIGHFLVMERDK